MIKRFACGPFKKTENLIDRKIFSRFNSEDLHEFFAKFDFDKVLSLDHRKKLFLLNRIADLGDSIPIKILKYEITQGFLNCEKIVIEYLIEQKFLSYLNIEEINIIFNQFDLTNVV